MKDNEKNGRKTVDHLNNPGREASQFKPGNPGGPGRPKGSVGIKRLMRQVLDQDEGKYAKEIAENAVKNARYDLSWLKFVMQSIDQVDA